MNKIYPKKIKTGDRVRILAPSRSLAIISPELRAIANQRFQDLGLELSFSEHASERDEFDSSSIQSRVADLHEAFADLDITAIFSVIGGFNSNQLLRYLDWDLIKNNPKIFCGFSDLTALNNAILAKTGLVTYSGPHYSTFGKALYSEYWLDYLKKCLISADPFEVLPSVNWSDNKWYLDQKDPSTTKNSGYLAINQGQAEGTILGGNLCTFNLLQGTEYFPDLTNSILFLEDDLESQPHHFDRDLQSLINLSDFKQVKGLVIGRFQMASTMTNEKLIKIIKTKKELDGLPVIANVDFGHTDPKITFPVGGEVSISVKNQKSSLKITKH